MTTPSGNETKNKKNIGDEHDDVPPIKIPRTDSMLHCQRTDSGEDSQGSVQSDEEILYSAGDTRECSGTDSSKSDFQSDTSRDDSTTDSSQDDSETDDRSDSPAAESDRLTPVQKFRGDTSDSHSNDEVVPISTVGDLCRGLEDITDSSDASQSLTVPTENVQERSPTHSSSPSDTVELPDSSEEPKTPCFSQADRVTALRRRMAVHSPSDNILSPCTMKLNQLNNFLRTRQTSLPLLSAEELSEENVAIEDTSDTDETNTTGDETGDDVEQSDDDTLAGSQEDSDREVI